ncbi:Flagellar basal-body rod protein FlgB [Anaerovibrio sp. JC8]|uniref:flagellar basal body rod protein FlgB n=1 Tax=Anaerovibrio sp. JC8 TaxID=1240085 RepID=UPI000A0E7834|nr:flagellar basal body rod protein FlgB [Anaerovibrio sp. JC8]ORU00411.1 Flagellar basal-body rod protein FlgB [Anaerovibrio sp. JC8]
MLDQIFNTSTMDYLSRGMSAANLRHEVISNNIANVNTPKFKKSDVVFESLLAKEMGLDKQLGLEMVRTHDRHMPIPMRERAEAAVVMDESTIMRTDKNNVDIDKEMANMAKNQIYYNAMTKEMGSFIQRLKTTITSK